MKPPKKKTVTAKMPIPPVGGVSGTSYPSYLKGAGATNPTPVRQPPKRRRALPVKRVAIIKGQAQLGTAMAKGAAIIRRGRFGR